MPGVAFLFRTMKVPESNHNFTCFEREFPTAPPFCYFSFRSYQGTAGLCGRQLLHGWQVSSSYPPQTPFSCSKDMWNRRLMWPWWVKVWYTWTRPSGLCIMYPACQSVPRVWNKPLPQVYGFICVNILAQIRNACRKHAVGACMMWSNCQWLFNLLRSG